MPFLFNKMDLQRKTFSLLNKVYTLLKSHPFNFF